MAKYNINREANIRYNKRNKPKVGDEVIIIALSGNDYEHGIKLNNKYTVVGFNDTTIRIEVNPGNEKPMYHSEYLQLCNPMYSEAETKRAKTDELIPNPFTKKDWAEGVLKIGMKLRFTREGNPDGKAYTGTVHSIEPSSYYGNQPVRVKDSDVQGGEYWPLMGEFEIIKSDSKEVERLPFVVGDYVKIVDNGGYALTDCGVYAVITRIHNSDNDYRGRYKIKGFRKNDPDYSLSFKATELEMATEEEFDSQFDGVGFTFDEDGNALYNKRNLPENGNMVLITSLQGSDADYNVKVNEYYKVSDIDSRSLIIDTGNDRRAMYHEQYIQQGSPQYAAYCEHHSIPTDKLQKTIAILSKPSVNTELTNKEFNRVNYKSYIKGDVIQLIVSKSNFVKDRYYNIVNVDLDDESVPIQCIDSKGEERWISSASFIHQSNPKFVPGFADDNTPNHVFDEMVSNDCKVSGQVVKVDHSTDKIDINLHSITNYNEKYKHHFREHDKVLIIDTSCAHDITTYKEYNILPNSGTATISIINAKGHSQSFSSSRYIHQTHPHYTQFLKDYCVDRASGQDTVTESAAKPKLSNQIDIKRVDIPSM